jgi:hypothetical protein
MKRIPDNAKQRLKVAIQKLNKEFEADEIFTTLVSESEGTKEMKYLQDEIVTYCQIYMKANIIVAKTMEEQMKLEDAVNEIWTTENSKQNTLFLKF